MPLPANTTTVVVRGTFNTPEGNPSTGTVTFTPSAWLLNSGANIAIPNSGVTKTLGTAGDFSVTLPITDDSDISPNPFIYTVSEVVDGVSQSYNISIPGTVATGGTIYLADLAPVAAAGPEYYSLASSLSIGTVSTLAAGSAATATITGLAPSQTLNLGIPTGPTGATGTAATVTVGTIGSTAYPGPGTVTNSGTSGSAVLDFVLVTGQTGATGPQGNTGTLAVGTVGSVPNSGTASVTNVGSSTAGTFDFILRDGPTGPQGATGATGAQGPSATIAVGTVGSVPNSGTATVTNSGSSTAGTFDFVLRDGPTGPQGATGSAATIAVGTVTSVAYGGTAAVTNVGSSTAGTFDFVLVTGPQGDLAGLSATAPLNYAANTFSLRYGAGLGTATGGTLVADFDTATPANLGVASAGTANKVSRSDHVHALPTASDVGAVGNSLVNAKGDLVTATANDTPAVLTAGSDGQMLMADSSATAGLRYVDPPANRNLIINGAMQVAQRGTTASGITSTGYYTADRWSTIVDNQGTWTQSVDADAPTGSGVRNSLKMLCTTADASPAAADRVVIRQRLEGQDLQRVKKGTSGAEQLTLSFWVKSNVTGTFAAVLIDEDNSREVDAVYTVTSSATWEKKTITFPADTTGILDNDNNQSLQMQFWLGAGTDWTSGTRQTSWGAAVNSGRAVGQTNVAAATNNYWQITGVQLETGPVATPFEFESYEATLRKCQRYYFRYKATGSVFAQYGVGTGQSTTGATFEIKPPVTMRTEPSAIEYATVRAADGTNATTLTALTIASGNSHENAVKVDATAASGLTQYRFYFLDADNSSASYFAASAEL